MQSERKHIAALDGVRGIAILMVLLHHCRFLLNPRDPAQLAALRLFDGGWSGVQLFFVLSGFLITGILLDTRDSPNYFSTFYARRFLRIFPVYYGYLLLVFVGLQLYLPARIGNNPWVGIDPRWYVFYVQNLRVHPANMISDHLLAHLWSLSVEEQFYLVWPLLVMILPVRALAGFSMALIPVALIPRLLWSGIGEEMSRRANTFTPSSLDALAIGALIAIAVRDATWRKRLQKAAGGVAALALTVFMALGLRSHSFFIYRPLIQTWGVTALTFLFGSVVFWAATGSNPLLSRILRFRPLTYLGRLSYGLYVLHPLVVDFVSPRLAGPPLTSAALDFASNAARIGILVALSIGVASLSCCAFERPILRWKDRFRYQPRTFSKAA